jgi:hypothetical protein
MTFAQLDPSAQAPWTRTTVASFIAIPASSGYALELK